MRVESLLLSRLTFASVTTLCTFSRVSALKAMRCWWTWNSLHLQLKHNSTVSEARFVLLNIVASSKLTLVLLYFCCHYMWPTELVVSVKVVPAASFLLGWVGPFTGLDVVGRRCPGDCLPAHTSRPHRSARPLGFPPDPAAAHRCPSRHWCRQPSWGSSLVQGISVPTPKPTFMLKSSFFT